MLDLVLGSDFILNLSLFTKLLFCCSTLFCASSRLISITFLNVSAFIYKLLISPKTFWVHLSPCFCIMASKLTNSCSSYESFLFDLISSFFVQVSEELIEVILHFFQILTHFFVLFIFWTYVSYDLFTNTFDLLRYVGFHVFIDQVQCFEVYKLDFLQNKVYPFVCFFVILTILLKRDSLKFWQFV